MRILFIGFPDSVHAARWIQQLAGTAWDVHFFPVYMVPPHPALQVATLHFPELTDLDACPPVHCESLRQRLGRYKLNLFDAVDWARELLRGRFSRFPWNKTAEAKRLAAIEAFDQACSVSGPSAPLSPETRRRILQRISQPTTAAQLAQLIDQLRPDVVHSLEIQHSAYLTQEARKLLTIPPPTWIVSNWGSDIYLFGQQPEHAPRIREVLAETQYLCCECWRDARLGQQFGFRGIQWPVVPNAGGFDLEKMHALRKPGPTSRRRVIMLKGYHGWAGRALVGLAAMEQCQDLLQGYQIRIYSPEASTQKAVRELWTRSSLDVALIPKCPHEEILEWHGKARISMGLSISDGASTSFLEALTMGAFPIQSHTACADEWIENGVSGILVPPEDPAAVAAALRRALQDDDLVNRAAEINWETAQRRLNGQQIRETVVNMYDAVYAALPQLSRAGQKKAA